MIDGYGIKPVGEILLSSALEGAYLPCDGQEHDGSRIFSGLFAEEPVEAEPIHPLVVELIQPAEGLCIPSGTDDQAVCVHELRIFRHSTNHFRRYNCARR